MTFEKWEHENMVLAGPAIVVFILMSVATVVFLPKITWALLISTVYLMGFAIVYTLIMVAIRFIYRTFIAKEG